MPCYALYVESDQLHTHINTSLVNHWAVIALKENLFWINAPSDLDDAYQVLDDYFGRERFLLMKIHDAVGQTFEFEQGQMEESLMEYAVGRKGP